MEASRITSLIQELVAGDVETRKKTLRRIGELGRQGLTFEEGCEALKAAALEWKEAEPACSQSLAAAALDHPYDGYLEIMVRDYPRYSANARWHVVHAIVSRGDVVGARTYLHILDTYPDLKVVPSTRLTGFSKSTEAVAILLPELLRRAEADPFGYEVQHLALEAVRSGSLSRKTLAPYACSILTLYRPMRESMRSMEKTPDNDWIWSAEYQNDRAHGTLLLDLMGFLSGEAIVEALEESLKSRDARVQYFALISLLRLGQDVTESAIQSVAASPETRNWFYEGLALLRRLPLFPRFYLSQEALAESAMVQWLIFPTELERAPHEIELMATFDSQQGDQRFYLFRFQTHPPHWASKKGWMAGLSGPFAIAAIPTTDGGGSTFSQLTEWEKKSPQEHFAEISGLIAEHWRAHVKNQEIAE